MLENTISPTRAYVAMLKRIGRNKGYFFRWFKLPDNYKNDSETAEWYYQNKENSTNTIVGCITYEDFSDAGGKDDIWTEENVKAVS